MDVEPQKAVSTLKDHFFDRIRRGFALSDSFDLVRIEILKAPACFVDSDAEWPIMLLEEVCRIVCYVPDLAFPKDVPKPLRESVWFKEH